MIINIARMRMLLQKRRIRKLLYLLRTNQGKEYLSHHLQALEYLDAPLFRVYQAKVANGFVFQCHTKHLDILLKVMQRAEASLKVGYPIEDEWYKNAINQYGSVSGIQIDFFQLRPVTLDQMMILSNDRYGDPMQLIGRFATLATNIYHLLEGAEEYLSSQEHEYMKQLNEVLHDMSGFIQVCLQYSLTI